jgi:mannose-6-phosphate isomerase-like protein (cupin superfamily)
MPQTHAELIANLPNKPDVIAPDGSEIRLLKSPSTGSSMVHALLHPGTTTHAVHHLTVEEDWYCVRGEGELWRKDSNGESVLKLSAGTTCDIPLGTIFQFRATGEAPLEIVITTTPPWPGDHEAVRADGKWEPTV